MSADRAEVEIPALAPPPRSLLLVASLTACVGIPTSSGVQVGGLIDDDQVAARHRVPARRSDPRVRSRSPCSTTSWSALQSPAGNYAVAQEFMTADLANTWQPNAQTTIRRRYRPRWRPSATPSWSTSSPAVHGWMTVGATSRPAPVSGASRTSSRKSNDEWRISAAPDGIVLTENSFDVVFRAVSLYFFDPALQLPRARRAVGAGAEHRERARRALPAAGTRGVARPVGGERVPRGHRAGTRWRGGRAAIPRRCSSPPRRRRPTTSSSAASGSSSRPRSVLRPWCSPSAAVSRATGEHIHGDRRPAASTDPLLMRTANDFGYMGAEGVVPIPI